METAGDHRGRGRIRKLAQKWKTETIHFLSTTVGGENHGPQGKFVYVLGNGKVSKMNVRKWEWVWGEGGKDVCGLREKPR